MAAEAVQVNTGGFSSACQARRLCEAATSGETVALVMAYTRAHAVTSVATDHATFGATYGALRVTDTAIDIVSRQVMYTVTMVTVTWSLLAAW